MTTVAAIKILTCLESVVLALLASREDPTSKSNRLFVRYIFWVAASSLVEFMLVISPTERMFLFWKHFDVCMYFAVASLFQFSLMLRGYAWAEKRRFRVLLYGAIWAVALLEGVVMLPDRAVPGSWSFTSEYASPFLVLHAVFVAAGSGLALATVVVLHGYLVHAKDLRSRSQASVFFWSTLVLVAVGASAELISAFVPGVQLPLSATATSAYLIVNPILAYAVVRYGLLQLSPLAAVSAIMEMMSEAVILIDQQGAVLYVNRAVRALTGEPKVRLGQGFLGGLTLRNGGGGASALGYDDLRNDGKGLRGRDCLLEVAGRDPVPVSVSTAVFESPLWGETGLILTLRDVSERHKMEDMRDSADRIMRHDLRNTLTGLYTLSGALVADPTLAREHREHAVMIHDGARLLNEQIDSYLYLRSVEDGAFKAPLDEVDLAGVLRSVLRNQGPLAESMNVHVAFLIDGRPADADRVVPVRGIRSMLFGIFLNFVKNAIEASPFAAEVCIDVRTATAITVAVRNRGVIPEEIRPRFFTKFATAGKRRGTGVGAYGAKIMAEALGGSVAFSTSQQQGTEVVVTFPAVPAS
jgi:signal transduction histidine kinase